MAFIAYVWLVALLPTSVLGRRIIVKPVLTQLSERFGARSVGNRSGAALDEPAERGVPVDVDLPLPPRPNISALRTFIEHIYAMFVAPEAFNGTGLLELGELASRYEQREDERKALASLGQILQANNQTLTGLAKATAEQEMRPVTLGDLITSFEDVGLSEEEDGCFYAPGNPRLGCSMGCSCDWWQQCYPKYLHWTVEHDMHESYNLGTCQITLAIYGVMSAILFGVCAMGVAIVRAGLLTWSSGEEESPTIMSTKIPIQVDKARFKPPLVSQSSLY